MEFQPEKAKIDPVRKIEQYCESFGSQFSSMMAPLPDGRLMVIKVSNKDGNQEGIFAFDRKGELSEFTSEDAESFVSRITTERNLKLTQLRIMKEVKA